MRTKVLCILILGLGAVLAQDDAPPADAAPPAAAAPPGAAAPPPANDAAANTAEADDAAPGAEGADGDTAEDSEADDCEESWEYIQFLREEVNDKVEELLRGLRDAKDQKGSVAILEDTVSKTMKKVLEVREVVLDRIFKLRKSEIATCPDQNIKQEENLTNIRMDIMSILLKLVERDAASVEKLKEVRDDLLELRMKVNNEVMRVMMLPQGRVAKKVEEGDCEECELLDGLSEKINKLIMCADMEEGATEEEEGGEGEDAGEGSGGGEGGECMPANMYFMELMDCNRKIDDETERLFPSLFATFDEAERMIVETKLNNLKAIREEIEDVITKLSKTKDEDKLKKTTSRSLAPISNKLQELVKECKAGCGPEGCDSCGAEVLYEMMEKMNYYLQIYNATEDGREPVEQNEEVRRDLMKYISTTSEDSTKILQKKIEGTMDDCDQQKMDVYNKTKNPMWMMVNTTIFTEGIEEPQVMVETMVEMLKQLLQEYCSGEEVTPRAEKDGPSCEWEEYEQTGEYINKIDEIIQGSLFKPKEDTAKRDAQLGFVEIRMMLDKRVEKLFQDNMVCPDEATTIKKEWMGELNRCMAVFMNSKLKFTEMTRLERLECTKTLRASMEKRRSDLLTSELEKSIDQIGEDAEGQADENPAAEAPQA